MMTTPISRWASAGCFGILVLVGLAGCGAASSGGTVSNPSEAVGADGRPRFGSEEFGLSTEELADRIEKIEADIGQCMTAAGFNYVPVDFDTVYEAMASSGSAPGVSDEDYLAQYGFGITTLVGEPDPVVVNGRGEQNIALYEALAPGDRVAYERALWGEKPDVTLARALENEDFSDTGGCTRAAAEQFFTPAELVGSYRNPADALIQADPRMVDAIAAWSSCLAEAGHQYDNPDALDADLADRLAAILGPGASGHQVVVAQLDGAAQAALTDLQGFERAVAQVAAACEEDAIVPVEEQIQTEIYGAPQL
jgi:hypothetical protein